MTVLAATLFIFLLAAAGLALGVMFGRNAVRGSCGGLSSIPGAGPACGCADPCHGQRRARGEATRGGGEPGA